MAVIRINKTTDYTVMSNTHFREKGMSLKAKGLLSLMLSLPDGWDYSITGLVTLSKDGKDSVMTALQELEEFRYLRRTRSIDEKGQFAGYDYDIFEKPYADEPNAENPKEEKPYAENPNTENPKEEKPYAENPNTENPQQLNTNQSITNQSSTDTSITEERKESKKKNSFDAIIAGYTNDPQIIDLLQEWLKVRKAKRAAMTDRAIQMNIDKLDELAKQSNMTVTEYLSEIICRGWAAFYEIKQFNNAPKKQNNASGNVFLDIAKDEGIY